MASGEVRAFDAATGALRWTFHPLPPDAQAGGANTWSQIVVDDGNGLVFLPTGSASPDYFGGLRVGQERLRELDRRAARRNRRGHPGTFRRSTTICGTTTSPPRRFLYKSKSGAGRGCGIEDRPRVPVRPAAPASRSSRSRNARCLASDVRRRAARSRRSRFPTGRRASCLSSSREEDLWGADPGGSRGVPRNAAASAQRGRVHAAEPARQPHRARQHRRPALGRRRVGSRTIACIIAPVNRLPAIIRLIPARAVRRAEEGASRRARPPSRTGAPYSMSREFFTVAVRPSVRGAALGRARRGARRTRDDRVATCRWATSASTSAAAHPAPDGIAEPRRPDRRRARASSSSARRSIRYLRAFDTRRRPGGLEGAHCRRARARRR